MDEIKPFRPLQVPVAIALNAFTIIALAELHSLDPGSDSTDSFTALTTIVFWTISAGLATYNSPQAQGAASAVFTVTALIGEIMPAGSDHRQNILSEISPILWVLA